MIFEPLDFIARLAALAPAKAASLLASLLARKLAGVPISAYRARITPSRRGRAGKSKKPEASEDRTPDEQQAAMRWAQRLKRVFQIEAETCPKCGGTVKVIACTRDGFAQGLLAFGKPPHRSRLR